MEAQLRVLIAKGVCMQLSKESYQKPLHDSSMYSNVEVNLNCAADFPVRFNFLAALARLAILVRLYLAQNLHAS